MDRPASMMDLRPRTGRAPLVLVLLMGTFTILQFMGEIGARGSWIQDDLGWAMGILAGLVFLVWWLRIPSRVPTEVYLWLAFLFWATLGFVNVSPANASGFLRHLLSVLAITAMFWLIATVAQDPKHLRAFFWFGCLGVVYQMGVVLIGGTAMAVREATGRFEGTVGNANAYSLVLVVGVVCCWSAIILTRNWTLRILILIPTLFAHFMIERSGSRTGLVVLGLMYVFFYLARWRSWSRQPQKIALLTAVFLAAGSFGLLSLSELNRERFAQSLGLIARDPAAPESDSSSRARVRMLATAAELWMKHPIFGVGLGGFIEYSEWNIAAHSGFGEVLAETGAVGFLLYYSIWLVVWLRLRRLRRHYAVPPDLLAVADLLSSWLLAYFIGNLAATPMAASAKPQPLLIGVAAGLCYYAFAHYRTKTELEDEALAESIRIARQPMGQPLGLGPAAVRAPHGA